jgi:lysozyme
VKASQTAIDLIKHFEGLRLQPYRDAAGHWTIGYGHLIRPGESYAGGIGPEKAQWMLEADMGAAESYIERVTGWTGIDGSSPMHDALVSLAFNVPRAFKRGTGLRRALTEGRLSDVPAEIRKWNKARVAGRLQPLPGLTRRREAEARLFQGLDWREPAAPQPTPRTLRRGDYSSLVRDLRRALYEVGYLPRLDSQHRFGPQTEGAVRRFQQEHGLEVDGIYGPKTAAALRAAAEGRKP